MLSAGPSLRGSSRLASVCVAGGDNAMLSAVRKLTRTPGAVLIPARPTTIQPLLPAPPLDLSLFMRGNIAP